ncbi:family 43 glycosylhydrolase [Actinoplanes sp. NPDC051343]|uniref:family 43 glycosylhydrolase n=1 Tax=Actinoplanes sp. NPDC051343 TaxID=3363906 RepID=UPI0037B59260
MRRWLAVLVTAAAALLFAPTVAHAAYDTTVTNFDNAGNQIVRLDVHGNAVDAHDGEISVFGGTYYLYGTAYDCGYQWQGGGTPFCGFKVYSSPDLVHWADRGYLFDPTTSTWQTRCNGNTYGCFRPHVVYNAATARYVLWVNVYDNSVGYRVFTATSPIGPFTEQAVPTLAVNNSAPAGGLNNGDHSLFVDDDGTAYLAYTDWRSSGDIVVERLDTGYLTGTGAFVRLHQSATEAPAMFKRNGVYYLTYSDPNCGYCGGTGTSYKTAAAPLGNWSAGTKLTTDSCGGQPAFVSAIPTSAGTTYLYASDLWNNGATNEALANYFWTPLSFSGSAIQAITCRPSFALDLAGGSAGAQQPAPDQDQADGVAGFQSWCDVGRNIDRIQTWVAGRTGTLTSVKYTTFQSGNPDAGLEVDVVTADGSLQPAGSPLFRTVVPQSSIGWSPRDVTIYPNVTVTAGIRYGIVVKSANTIGCYGMVHNDNSPYPGGGEGYSSNSGGSFTVETNRSIRFATTVSSRSVLSAGALPAGWTACAGEHGVCAVPAPGMIAYGAPGGYVYQSVAAGVMPCTTVAFGGDPAYGTLKSCYLPPQGGPSGYAFCAGENGNCTVSGTRTVAYGLNGAYSYRSVNGSVTCGNDAFGDPLYSVAKSCYVAP